jgi:hypothetical protein
MRHDRAGHGPPSRSRHSIQEDDLVAPIELVGLPGSEARRDIGRSRCLAMLLGPSPGPAAQRIVATIIAAPAELLEDPDQRQLLASRFGCVTLQQFVEFSRRLPNFGRGWIVHSCANDVSPARSTRRTVFRDTSRSRVISLIVLPLAKRSCRIRPTVSTTSIP